MIITKIFKGTAFSHVAPKESEGLLPHFSCTLKSIAHLHSPRAMRLLTPHPQLCWCQWLPTPPYRHSPDNLMKPAGAWIAMLWRGSLPPSPSSAGFNHPPPHHSQTDFRQPTARDKQFLLTVGSANVGPVNSDPTAT
jgi:hypothetical protein